MKKREVLHLLSARKQEITHRFGVKTLALFGSMARDESREDSDVDVLAEFDGPADSDRYFGLQFYLEDLLGRHVDLVTTKALRPELRQSVEREAIRAD